MNSTLRITLLVLVILALAGTLVYWWGLPEVLAIYPPDNSGDVRAGSEIRLEFSKPMQPDSVLQRLSIEPSIPGRYLWQGQTLAFIPDQPWSAGTLVQVRLDRGVRTAGSLSFHMREGIQWTFRIRQPALAYLFPSGGAANIYALNTLSGENRPLTDQPLGVIDFSVDSAGARLYFSAQTPGGGSAVFLLKLDSEPLAGEATPSTELPQPLLVWDCLQALCRLPVAAPQGDLLAFERTPHPGADAMDLPQVWLLPLTVDGLADPAAAPRLAGEPGHQTLQPAWSSDGFLAFYDSQLTVFVILEPASGETSTFTNQTGQPGDWHPAGRYFVAPEINFLEASTPASTTGQPSLANSHLMLFDRLQQTMQDLSVEIEAEDTSPSFSPDGSSLAFARKYLDRLRWIPGRQVYLMHLPADLASLPGSQALPITASPDFNHYDLAWNPDGQQIAYVRFNQTMPVEPPEIWLLDLLSGRSVKLITGGYAPAWIP